MVTPIKGFEELTSAQASKFVTVNRNMAKSEVISGAPVVSRSQTTSPASPAEGDAYIIAGLGGDWASGAIGDIAHYYLGVWRFYSPKQGWEVSVKDEANLKLIHNGSTWVVQASSDTGISGLTDNSIPFVSGDVLSEDTNLNYDPTTDTLSAPNIAVSGSVELSGYADMSIPYLNSGVLDADSNFNYDYATGTLSVPNLVVTGDVTEIEATNMNVNDSVVSFAYGNATDSLDIGWVGVRQSGNVANFWDESNDEFAVVNTSSTSADSTLAITSYAAFKAGNINAQGTLTATGLASLNGGLNVSGNTYVSSNLGVGIASPILTTHFRKSGAGRQNLSLFEVNNGGDIAYLQVALNADNNTVHFNTTGSSASDFVFETGSVEAMRVTTNRNLLVGTTSDNGNRLQVSGNASVIGNMGVGISNPLAYNTGTVLAIGNTSGDSGLSLVASTTGKSRIRFSDGTGASAYQGYINYDHNLELLEIGANGGQAINIPSTRNILIGTTTDNGNRLQVSGNAYVSDNILVGDYLASPVYPVTINDNTNNSYIHFVNSVTGSAFSDGSQIGVPAGQSYLLLNQRENSHIQFNTNGTEAGRFSPSQNLLLGTTTDNGNRLRIKNSDILSGDLLNLEVFDNNRGLSIGLDEEAGVYSAFVYYDKKLAGYGGHQWRQAGSTLMTLKHTGNLLIGTTTDNGNKLQVNGSAYINGPLFIESATPSGNINLSSTIGAEFIFARNDTNVIDGENLGAITFQGNDTTGNSYRDLAYIICEADGTHSAGNNPTRFTVSVTPLGSETPAERLRLDSTTTADDTALLLWDVTAGTLKRVTRGAADSGGTGYRVLRISN